MTRMLNECEPAAVAVRQANSQIIESTRHTEEFLATLGHEMRNPLNALEAALELWATGELDAVEVREIRQLMQRQVQQLTHLSDDLLDVARIVQGKFELHAEQVSLQQVIREACEEVQPVIEKRRQKLTVHLPAAALIVCGDASRLLQVFANLIQNGSKFTDRDGRLEVALEAQQDLAVVRVRDNGRGIAAHLLDTIFESFTKGGETRVSNDGLGIGLRLVKTIVERHGGYVVAHSDGRGRGSEFTVQLPLWSPSVDTLGLHPQNPELVAAVPRALRRFVAS